MIKLNIYDTLIIFLIIYIYIYILEMSTAVVILMFFGVLAFYNIINFLMIISDTFNYKSIWYYYFHDNISENGCSMSEDDCKKIEYFRKSIFLLILFGIWLSIAWYNEDFFKNLSFFSFYFSLIVAFYSSAAIVQFSLELKEGHTKKVKKAPLLYLFVFFGFAILISILFLLHKKHVILNTALCKIFFVTFYFIMYHILDTSYINVLREDQRLLDHQHSDFEKIKDMINEISNIKKFIDFPVLATFCLIFVGYILLMRNPQINDLDTYAYGCISFFLIYHILVFLLMYSEKFLGFKIEFVEIFTDIYGNKS